MDDIKKQKNKEYYERNKARILAKRKAAQGNVLSKPEKPIKRQRRTSEKVSKPTPRGGILTRVREFNFERALIWTLILVTTFFLIAETGRYMNQTEGGGTGLIKAVIGEGIVVALSWLSFKSVRGRLAKFFLLLALFAFNVWTLSGSVVAAGDQSVRTAAVLDPKITELETVVATKQKLFTDALGRNRRTLARKYEQEIDETRKELQQARSERLKIQSPKLTTLNTIQSVLFRFIVMSANALLVSQLRGLNVREPRQERGVEIAELS